jgi:Ca2+-binding RTX toxin-like protein
VDALAGGGGNDTYWVNAKADVVVEATGRGTDTVNATANYTLSDNVENLVLEGTGNFAATGNALANHLTGNAGNNVLDGGAGADRMAGGLGNDTYYVDNSADVVTETAGNGTDLVMASASFALTGAVENLTLRGTAAIDGTGDSLANAIIGNTGANSLSGLGGNDVLTGRGGADTLTGGSGADTFQFKFASDTPMAGRDTIEDFHHGQHDLIDLAVIDAITGGADDAFTLTDAFHHVAGEMIVTTVAAGHYLVEGDTNGDGIANFGIDVFATTALSAADFVL